MSPEILREKFYWERVESLRRAADIVLRMADLNPTGSLHALLRLRKEVANVAPPSLDEMP